MELSQVYELLERFEGSSLASFELTCSEFTLKLGKAAPVPAVLPAAAPAAAAPTAKPASCFFCSDLLFATRVVFLSFFFSAISFSLSYFAPSISFITGICSNAAR